MERKHNEKPLTQQSSRFITRKPNANWRGENGRREISICVSRSLFQVSAFRLMQDRLHRVEVKFGGLREMSMRRGKFGMDLAAVRHSNQVARSEDEGQG